MPSPFPLKIPGLPVVLTTFTKGGSGKSSSVQAILVAAKVAGFRAAALDLDPIGSLYKWKTRRRFTQAVAKGKERFGRQPKPDEIEQLLGEPDPDDEITVSPTQPHAIKDSLTILKRAGKNFVVIDTAGSKTNYADTAGRHADLVLLATKPSTKELEHMPDTLDQLAVAGHPPRFCLFNRVHHSVTTGLEQPQRMVREHYNTAPFPYHFTHRAAVWDMADDMGLGPQELEPNGAVAQETANVFRFICEFLNLGRSEQNAAGTQHIGTAVSSSEQQARA